MQTQWVLEFNFETMRMEWQSFAEVVLNPVAQVKFVHTVASGYTTGAMFILGISSYYILKGRDLAFARRSFLRLQHLFGMAAILSVIVLGDESGYELGEVQKVKLAAAEAKSGTLKKQFSCIYFAKYSKPRNNEYWRTHLKIPLRNG